MEQAPHWHEYIGAVHVHSSYSDGTRSIPDIARIGQSAGLDFILIADHMTLQGREKGFERWYENLLVLVGCEINDPDNRNHYLAFNVDRVAPGTGGAADYVRRVREGGGIGFIAHPDEDRRALRDYPGYPWTRWDVEGYDGMEIWNQMSEWMEQLTPVNKYFKVFSPRKSVLVPPAKTLARWDQLARQRKVVGIGGVDVHAFGYRLGPFTVNIFPYKVFFKSIRTHLLLDHPLDTGDFPEARQAVYGCLKQGRLFFANFRRGDASGFRFWAARDGRIVTMGDRLELKEGGVDFWVRLPRKGDISLIHDGRRVARTCGRELFYSTDLKGAYRVEVTRRDKGWIYSNHIHIT